MKLKINYKDKTFNAPDGWRFLRNGERIKMGDIVLNTSNINDFTCKYVYYPIQVKLKQSKDLIPSLRKIS